MAREVLCSRIVDDVDAELERPLEVGRHHGVVEDNDGVLQRRDRATKEGKENYHQLVVDFVSGNRQGREEGRWMRCSRRLPLSFVQGLTSDSASSSLYGRPSHLPPLLHLTSNSSCGTIPPSLVADHHCKPTRLTMALMSAILSMGFVGDSRRTIETLFSPFTRNGLRASV
jgi:hypothetical protein